MSSYLVTGSSRGLGLATVAFLAGSSKTDVKIVFAAARSETPDLKKLAEESSGRVVVVKMDIVDRASVDSAVKVVEERLGDNGLDALINNAGASGFTPGWTDQMTDLNEAFNINVTGAHIVTTKFLPLLRRGQMKKIANIGSSLGSFTFAPKLAAYPILPYKVAKTALNALTVQWALALANEGFVVVSLNPGTVQTDMAGDFPADLTREEAAKAVVEATVKADSARNGTFYMLEVPGKEKLEGIHQYDGGICQW